MRKRAGGCPASPGAPGAPGCTAARLPPAPAAPCSCTPTWWRVVVPTVLRTGGMVHLMERDRLAAPLARPLLDAGPRRPRCIAPSADLGRPHRSAAAGSRSAVLGFLVAIEWPCAIHSSLGRTMARLAALLALGLLCGAALASAAAGQRVLVLLDDAEWKDSHSQFLEGLRARDYELDVKTITSASLQLKSWDAWLYDKLVIFGGRKGEPLNRQAGAQCAAPSAAAGLPPLPVEVLPAAPCMPSIALHHPPTPCAPLCAQPWAAPWTRARWWSLPTRGATCCWRWALPSARSCASWPRSWAWMWTPRERGGGGFLAAAAAVGGWGGRGGAWLPCPAPRPAPPLTGRLLPSLPCRAAATPSLTTSATTPSWVLRTTPRCWPTAGWPRPRCCRRRRPRLCSSAASGSRWPPILRRWVGLGG